MINLVVCTASADSWYATTSTMHSSRPHLDDQLQHPQGRHMALLKPARQRAIDDGGRLACHAERFDGALSLASQPGTGIWLQGSIRDSKVTNDSAK